MSSVFACVHACVRVCMYVCVDGCVHACVYVCMGVATTGCTWREHPPLKYQQKNKHQKNNEKLLFQLKFLKEEADKHILDFCKALVVSCLDIAIECNNISNC